MIRDFLREFTNVMHGTYNVCMKELLLKFKSMHLLMANNIFVRLKSFFPQCFTPLLIFSFHLFSFFSSAEIIHTPALIRIPFAGVIYVPVLLLLLVNLFFYWNSNQMIGKQLTYNRSMQHFQVRSIQLAINII